MIAKFLNESFVLRTDEKGFLEFMKKLRENPDSYKSKLILSDKKPSSWFVGEDKKNQFVCYSMAHFYPHGDVNDFIAILREQPHGASEEVRLRQGNLIPTSDKEACKLAAMFVRNLMKSLSRMNTMEDMVQKVKENYRNLMQHDWTRDGMAKIV